MTYTEPMKTAVIGASGYAGGELLRLLAIHPHFELTVVSAHSNAGELVTSVHPQLQSYAGRSFVATDSIDFSSLDLVFLALPHGESAALIEKIPASVKIVPANTRDAKIRPRSVAVPPLSRMLIASAIGKAEEPITKISPEIKKLR